MEAKVVACKVNFSSRQLPSVQKDNGETLYLTVNRLAGAVKSHVIALVMLAACFRNLGSQAINTNMRQVMIREEIQFWRRLIEKWETTHDEPAPERMRDALANAEMRLNRLLLDEGRERCKTLFH